MFATWMFEENSKCLMTNDEGIPNDANDEGDAREIAFWEERRSGLFEKSRWYCAFHI